MRDYVRGAWRDVTIKRDGSVLVDGELAGFVRGEPRAWLWISHGGIDGSRGFHFSKREAATACAWSHVARREAEIAPCARCGEADHTTGEHVGPLDHIADPFEQERFRP